MSCFQVQSFLFDFQEGHQRPTLGFRIVWDLKNLAKILETSRIPMTKKFQDSMFIKDFQETERIIKANMFLWNVFVE